MVRWWAAFFVSGLVAPPGRSMAWAGACVSAALAIFETARPGRERRERARGPAAERRRRSLATFVVTCAAGMVLWSAAGLERAAWSGTAGHSRTADHSESAGRSGALGRGRFESLALTGARAFLVGRCDDGRLTRRSRGIVGALVLGDRSGLDPSLRETYSYLGIAHFLALSGLHLGAIALPLAKVFPRLLRSRRRSDAALFACLCAYAAVASFPASLLRALALTAAVLACRHLGLHADLLGALVGGSFALVCLDGSLPFDAGFELSFAAVCGIALVGVPLARIVEPRLPSGLGGKALKIVLFPALITVSVQFLTLPLVIGLFSRSSLLSPLVNVIVSLPFTALLYAGSLYVFIPLGPLRALLAPAINLLCRFLAWAPGLFARGPHPALYRGDVRNELYLSGALFVAWSLRCTCPRRRAAALAGAVLVSLSLVLHPVGPGPRGAGEAGTGSIRLGAESRERAVFLAVEGGILVVGERFGPAEARRMTRSLWNRGVRRLACCVVAPARIGSRSGLPYLLARIRVDQVLCSPYLLAGGGAPKESLGPGGRQVRAVSRGDSVRGGSWVLEILGPVYPPPSGGTISEGDAAVVWRIVPVPRTPAAGE
jgi:ComEC/Rec2-related protein